MKGRSTSAAPPLQRLHHHGDPALPEFQLIYTASRVGAPMVLQWIRGAPGQSLKVQTWYEQSSTAKRQHVTWDAFAASEAGQAVLEYDAYQNSLAPGNVGSTSLAGGNVK